VKKNTEKKKEPYPLKRKRFTLSEEEKSNIFTQLEELLKNEKRIQFAYLFGSFVEKLPFHDIDLSIWVNGLLDKDAISFSVELSGRLTRQMNYPVDIRILNFAPVPFRFEVVRGKRIYVRDEQTHSEFLEDTMRRYLDIQPILYRATKEAFAE